MAKGTDHGGITPSIEAGEALTAKINLAVKLATTGEVEVCDTQGEQAIGILNNAPADEAQAAVRVSGTALWMAGGALNAMVRLQTTAAGKAEALTTGNNCVAVSLEPATGDEDVIEVKLVDFIDTNTQ